MDRSKRKKQEQTKRRFEAIKNLMSTFAMSTVAVVAAVTLIPASPKAEIVRAVPLSEEVAYNVMVTDEENALDLSTLFVVLENQLEYYETPINLGENTGYFEGLTANTEYRLSIYGSKGFGQERLDTIKVTTNEKVSATILSVNPVEDVHSSSYTVDIKVYDPEGTYTSINLYYGYAFEPGEEIIYTSVPITEDRMEVVLSDIFTTDSFHVYVEGITGGQAELLDEVTISPPYIFNAYVYLSTITKNSVHINIYGDMEATNTSYQIDIYTNNMLVRTEIYTPPEGDDHHDQGYIIDSLTPGVLYMFEITAIYQNPNTLREERQSIYSEEITTLENYSYDYAIETFDEFYEITITMDDPNDYFDIVYYEVYDTSLEFDSYIEGMTFPFELIGEEKISTITIYIPTSEAYRIEIGIRNQDDFTINEIIDLIEVN